MSVTRVLIANRAEIAIRIARACAGLGIGSVAAYSTDDHDSLHVFRADESVPLPGVGPAAYLDIDAIIAAAASAGCDAIHPGYGFLSENAELARRCASAGLVFVGPQPETLAWLGDKARARALAVAHRVPVLPGTAGPTTLEQAADFLHGLGRGGAIMLKALAGGGGRGMQPVTRADDLAAAFARCRAEAESAFGNGLLYVEQLLRDCRHVEVQIVGDLAGTLTHVGERECSLQRRGQKLVEIAPCPGMPEHLRGRIVDAALDLAGAVGYVNVGTFEFLVDGVELRDDSTFFFIEANPRLQVEHTVTEEAWGVDLVQAQLRVARGELLADLGFPAVGGATPRPGYSMQLRVNAETMDNNGLPRASGGELAVFDLPSGAGVRVDATGYRGYRTNPRFDSLLAKVIVSSSGSFADVMAKAYRALCETQIVGVSTNVSFLQALMCHSEVIGGRFSTTFVERHAADLLVSATSGHRRLFVPAPETAGDPQPHAGSGRKTVSARVDPSDPLAVLAHGKSDRGRVAPETPSGGARPSDDEEMVAVTSSMPGTIIGVDIAVGDLVRAGQQLLVMEAMKMQHAIVAPVAGRVRALCVEPGDTVYEGETFLRIAPQETTEAAVAARQEIDLSYIRPDLAEVLERQAITRDERRPDAVERRRKTGQRTARENIDDLCDPGTFIEYGSLTIAAQRRRRSLDDLIARTPADGMIAGVGTVNGVLFGEERARCAITSYDYTVLAGTQGKQNHRKKDRLFEIAERYRLPLVVFTEGGGGRPGDTDGIGNAALDCMAFALFGGLSGLVPLVGINSGRCFAGNAALLGCCDVVIATANSSIGMGGPAMIEGGGLGVFHPDEVGPMDVQVPNGVVDIAVTDEAEAVAAAKKYLSYFQGSVPTWEHADQRRLRHVIPENRLRIYDVRSVIDLLADTGSVLELRPHFGLGMVTALARVEGRPLGVIANNPSHLAGAIDSDGADKAARFMQLCDAFDVPILFLCDTPGMMVGPEVERTGLVRHCSRLFVTGASLTVPFFTIVLRKGYGLGAQAMAGGSFHAPFFTVAWPTGEFGGMGLEGAVKLGFRNELVAKEDPQERKALFDAMVAEKYEQGKAVSEASYFEIDDVIDPADSRRLIMRALKSAPPSPVRTGKKRPCIDTW